MPLDITNPAVTKFLVENYEKETRLRLRWNVKNTDAINDAATLHRKPTNYFDTDVIALPMKEGMAALKRDYISGARNKRKVAIRDGLFIPTTKDLRHGHSIVDINLGNPKEDPQLERPDTDLTIDPIMRPVDPTLKEIVYKSKPEFGRVTYLNKRSKLIPENRYYFPECTYWDHGWRLCDNGSIKGPEYPRVFNLVKAMRTRVGPQPDPPHYNASENCN